MSKIYDVIVLGAGPAGLTAGLYAGRSRLSTLIIEKGQDGGQIAITNEIENYPGQQLEGESGPSLIARMTEQAKKFGCERVSDTIKSVDFSGKTKKLIEMINTTAQEDNGSVVCVEAKSTMTFDLHYHVRLISAYEYDLSNYEALRGFLFGLYAGNYDISHIFIDNLFKITGGECNQAADDFLNELERFSNATGVKFTISVSGDPALATDGMQKYL